MSDLNLLLFGCGVSFVAIGGAYVYIRESFAGSRQARPAESKSPESETKRLHDVA